jgi:ABC-type sugar transport system permease subunit
MAVLSIGIVMTWVLSGFTTVVYLAALQNIPPELYEASAIDGAGPWKQFRLITARMVAPATTITVTVGLIMMLKVYDVIVAMTSGGPALSTQSTSLYIIKVAFTNDESGYASAIAMLLLVISAVISLTVTGLLRRREIDL